MTRRERLAHPLDDVPSIKLKLGFVIAAAVAVTVFVFWVLIKIGVWPSVSGIIAAIIAMTMVWFLSRGMTSPLRETMTGDIPCVTTSFVTACTALSIGRRSANRRGVPQTTRVSAIVPSTPRPGSATTLLAICNFSPRRRASARMAPAMGCSDCDSTDAASNMTSSALYPLIGTTVSTVRRPVVTVPVLSNATTRTLARRSR